MRVLIDKNLDDFVKKESDFFVKCAELVKNGEMSFAQNIGGDYKGVVLYGANLNLLNSLREKMNSYLTELGQDYPVVCSPDVDKEKMLVIGFYCINVGKILNHNFD
jgi:hypothetical protein